MTSWPRPVYCSTKTSQAGASVTMPTYFRSPHLLLTASESAESSTAYAVPHHATATSSTARLQPMAVPRRQAT